MKAKLLVDRDVMEFHPGTSLKLAPDSLVSQCRREGKRLIAPAGTVIEDAECWRIVQMGQAEAADDECAAAVGMTPEALATAQRAAKRLAAGIIPQDFEKFDAGQIAGYNADGSYKPGPNATPEILKQAKDSAALKAAKESEI